MKKKKKTEDMVAYKRNYNPKYAAKHPEKVEEWEKRRRKKDKQLKELANVVFEGLKTEVGLEKITDCILFMENLIKKMRKERAAGAIKKIENWQKEIKEEPRDL